MLKLTDSNVSRNIIPLKKTLLLVLNLSFVLDNFLCYFPHVPRDSKSGFPAPNETICQMSCNKKGGGGT